MSSISPVLWIDHEAADYLVIHHRFEKMLGGRSKLCLAESLVEGLALIEKSVRDQQPYSAIILDAIVPVGPLSVADVFPSGGDRLADGLFSADVTAHHLILRLQSEPSRFGEVLRRTVLLSVLAKNELEASIGRDVLASFNKFEIMSSAKCWNEFAECICRLAGVRHEV